MSCGGTCSQPHSKIQFSKAWHLPSPIEWLFGGWFSRLVHWQARWRSREELRDLSDAQLRDVGLTREQIDESLRQLPWS